MLAKRRRAVLSRREHGPCALPDPLRLLILGGTTEASLLARHLAGVAEVAATVSLAGRTQQPIALPLPCRVGGFGGVDGLERYLRDSGTAAAIDATHPFAARMSAHAAAACARLAVPLATFTRPPWVPEPGDRWTSVLDLDTAARALGQVPRRVLLTTGRLGLAAFRAAPQHSYIGRTIDPPDPADLPPTYRAILGRGPFPLDAEIGLMREARIDVLVTKNSGGDASAAKLEAARALALPVVMVEPPARLPGPSFTAIAAVLRWIAAQRAAP